MTGFRPSSETMAVATLTVVSLVGGLAVACVAGAGASGPGVKHRSVAASAAASPGSSAPAPAAPTALDSPELRYPADAVVDVKAAYHALGDGHADDTAALQAALSANPGRPLYLPAGTYLVRGALAARLAPLRLYGEKRDATVIRLTLVPAMMRVLGNLNWWPQRRMP